MRFSIFIFFILVPGLSFAEYRDDVQKIFNEFLSSGACTKILLEIKKHPRANDPIKVMISPKGKVKSVDYKPKNRKLKKYASCIKMELPKVSFPAPPNPKGEDYSYHSSVDFDDNEARQENPTIDREAIKKEMSDGKKQFQECYVDYQERNGKNQGRVALSWNITPKGKAADIVFKADDINDALFKDCLETVLSSLNFPKAPEGTVANINYPLKFRPK
ncbi:MAG: AgmX/PglI C-terminal domain-containing protein [Pseudobdellovibrionaceae bacterium]